jgi:thermitase
VGALLALALAGGSAARDRSTARGAAPSLLVKFAGSVTPRSLLPGDKLLGKTLTGVAVIQVANENLVRKRLAAYSALPVVVYAERNASARGLLAAPNDPSYSQQWALGTIRAVEGWSIFPAAYGMGGGPNIAIVDTGVDSNHQDLDDGRVLTGLGANCMSASGTCVAGSALDDNGHGTHVAGIAAAATNNLSGVAGTAFISSLMPVKVLDANALGSYAAITNGIMWSAQHGARVINLSLGGTTPSQTLCDAVSQAISLGALVVVAAGNGATSAASYPAACAGAVGVAATDSGDNPASFSNFGQPDVFVSAPGVSIYSTYKGNTYATMSGTSMATPFVSGLAALLFAEVPSRTVADVKTVLATTSAKITKKGSYDADPYGTCGGCTWNASYGYGRIDAYRALAQTAPKSDFAVAASPAAASTAPGGSATYSVSVASFNGFSATVAFSVSGLPAGATASFAPSSVAAPGSSQLTVATALTTAPGRYPLTISGTSGATTHTTAVALVVTSVPTVGTGSEWDFTLTVPSNPAIVMQGLATSYTIAVAPVGVAAGTVAFSVNGVPDGATAAFVPPTVTAPGYAELAVDTSPWTAPGTYKLTVTAASGERVHSADVTLVVKASVLGTVPPPPAVPAAPTVPATPAVPVTLPGGITLP